MIPQEKILVTGGSGLLGTALKKLLPNADYPGSDEFDITDPAQMDAYISARDFGLLFHGGAFTSPPKINENPKLALDVNIVGTANVVSLCMRHNLKLIYISTDYVFDGNKGDYLEDDPVFPVNKYAWSKLGGECAVRLYDNSVIVRTTFGPDSFPYPKAFIDQWTSRENVTKTARMLVELLKYDDLTGTVHVGGRRKSVYEYAQENSNGRHIDELSTNEIDFVVPRDTSLNCNKYHNIVKK